jgi:exodeoxyribonuclease-3
VISLFSWNINSVRARLPVLEALLQEEAPSILMLQETKVQDDAFPLDIFDRFHYNVVVFGQKSYNGVAIASKGPIEEVSRLSLGCDGEARYIEATTLGVRVGCVYVPNGQSLDSPAYSKKLMFLDQLRSHARPFLQTQDPFVLAGDFNVAPYPEDVAQEKKWEGNLLCSPKERQALRAFFHEGWIDPLHNERDHQKNPFTWWDYRGRAVEKDDGLRIDFCLLSPRAFDQKREAGVAKKWRLEEKPSDHAPVWVRLASL